MIKRILSLSFLVAGLSLLTGCASIVSGTHQSVSVQTGQVSGATCALENNKGRWYVNGTPGTVTINRSYHDLSIDCSKPGFRAVHKVVSSNTKALAFGNAIFGGVVGAGIDVADGAAYDYPTQINVPMGRGANLA